MKTILVVLLLSVGVGTLMLAPLVGETAVGAGVKLPRPIWSNQPAKEYKTDGAGVVRIMQIVGGTTIIAAILVGLIWRPKSQKK